MSADNKSARISFRVTTVLKDRLKAANAITGISETQSITLLAEAYCLRVEAAREFTFPCAVIPASMAMNLLEKEAA